MPRVAREKGQFLVYHVIQRGNERKSVFLQDDDRVRFLEILRATRARYGYGIYCYCLMENHVHLIVADEGADLSQVMKSVNVSYAMYFNRKYGRCGHLFQDRFKSLVIPGDAYLLELSRYIHHNPVGAGIVERPEDYPWSSYRMYTGMAGYRDDVVDATPVLKLFAGDLGVAARRYMEFMSRGNEGEEYKFMRPFDEADYQSERGSLIMGRKEAMAALAEFAETRGLNLPALLSKGNGDRKARREAMRMLRKRSSLTLKEIGEIFGGLSESVVSRVTREEAAGYSK